MQLLLGRACGFGQRHDGFGQVHAQLHASMDLHHGRHQPGFKQPRVGHTPHGGQPAPHKLAVRVLVLRLFDGVVDPRGVDAGGARLHLQLAPVDARLVVEKLRSQPLTHRPPMQPQRVGRDRHQHGPHAKVQPTGFPQHGDARVHHGPTGAGGFEGVKERFIKIVLTQAVIATVHVLPLDGGLALQLLNEVTVPVQATDESGQTRAVPRGLWRQLRDVRPR